MTLLTQRFDLFRYLEGEFSGRGQDECKISLGVFQQRLQYGNGKGAGLPRPGLGQADDVFALQGYRDGFLLDLGGRFPFQRLARLAQHFRHPLHSGRV